MKQLFLTFFVIIISALLISGCSNTGNISNPQNTNPDNQSSTWFIPGDFPTIGDAMNSSTVHNGDIIKLGTGNFTGVLLTKSLKFEGNGNTVINAGPAHSSGYSQGFRLGAGSDGSSFNHMTFTTDLSIMNGAAVNNVKVSHCEFLNSLQAISNWCGSGWIIEHNTITDLKCANGGGIGILVADLSGGTVQGNQILHNTITGVLHVDAENEGGGYSGTGIVIYADFRYGRFGTAAIKNNNVTHNTISLTSEHPELVDVVAFELTDTREEPPLPYVLNNNTIMFNDFRGTVNQIAISPAGLDNPVNNITRNLGENRGHGLHPGDFKP
ncbi:MAG: hypothetical protein EHM58_19720 [Ignavibacteriae bacterium]|nr:MAG: hypothetical protein EHM58_19720 [Ignavibacteriota bacterium]